ncbi:MAG TPA: glycosyl hydrolase 108 family protein [Gammaproteobacteria bacterium]|jgi:lysozyme family protein
MSFEQALSFTLKEEGGYVDDPRDSGGATNRGITQAVYDAWRMEQALPSHGVKLLSEDEVQRIYRERYWDAGHCGELPAALGIVHFDWCVNHGIRGAVATLQETVGAIADGEWGPGTAAAAAKAGPDAGVRYDESRREWYRHRVIERPDQAGFLKGWLGRVDRLDKYVEGL